MTIPPKYEDLVFQLNELNKREAALREELDRYKSLFNQAQKAIDRLNELHPKRMGELAKRLTVAEQRVIIMEKALTRIARPHDCGCLPCTGDCTSKLSLEITVDGMRETAELALKGLCETCHDQGEIFVSKGKFEYGMESEPDPIYKPCPVCSKAALKPAEEGEGS